MLLAIYTLVHVAIGLVGIATGLVVLAGLLTGQRLDRWTSNLLATTVATSVTGFGFPFVHFLLSQRFVATQLIVLLTFLVLGVFAMLRFRPAAAAAPASTRNARAVGA
jgi:hypothetical protein